MIESSAAQRMAYASLAVGVAVAVFAVYWPGLYGPLLLDDEANLQPVRDWLEGRRAFVDALFGNASGVLGRPVSMLTFLANAATTGGAIAAFKATNVAIHALTGGVVFLLARELMRTDQNLSGRADAAAAFLACAWIFHPVFASTVLYVVQRMAQLSALFAFAAILAFVHGMRFERAGRLVPAAMSLFALVPALTLLAMLSKENGALVPLLCLAIAFGRDGTRAFRAPVTAPFLLLFVLLPAIAATLLVLLDPHWLLGGYEQRQFTLWERVLSQPRALATYVVSILVPNGRLLGIFTDDFPASHSLLEPATTALAILAWAAVLALALARRQRRPLQLTGLLFFLAGHALESSVLPLELYFEHRNYLPAFGILLVVTDLACELIARLRDRAASLRTLSWIAAVGVVVALAAATHVRARAWRSEGSLVYQSLQSHPGSLRARLLHATLLARAGRYGESRRVLAGIADDAQPDHRVLGVTYDIVIDCLESGRSPRAKLEQLGALGHTRMIFTEISGYWLLARQPESCIAAADVAAALDRIVAVSTQPEWVDAKWRTRALAAMLYERVGMLDEARRHATIAWDTGVAESPIGGLLAGIHLAQGDLVAAASTLRELRARVRKHDIESRLQIERLQAQLDLASRATPGR